MRRAMFWVVACGSLFGCGGEELAETRDGSEAPERLEPCPSSLNGGTASTCWNNLGAGRTVDCNYNFAEGRTILFRACVGEYGARKIIACADFKSANTAN